MSKNTAPGSTRAPVYIWPLLSLDDHDVVEDQLVGAGYETKRKVKVGRVICWEVK
jgi:hypothetical protein